MSVFGFEISLEETVHSWKLIPYSLLAANGFLSSLNANCTVATGGTNITAILNLVMCLPNMVKFYSFSWWKGNWVAKDDAPQNFQRGNHSVLGSLYDTNLITTVSRRTSLLFLFFFQVHKNVFLFSHPSCHQPFPLGGGALGKRPGDLSPVSV